MATKAELKAQIADLRARLAAAEIARLRAFLAAIAEAIDAEHRVAVDLPGRVAQLWNEQVEGL